MGKQSDRMAVVVAVVTKRERKAKQRKASKWPTALERAALPPLTAAAAANSIVQCALPLSLP